MRKTEGETDRQTDTLKRNEEDIVLKDRKIDISRQTLRNNEGDVPVVSLSSRQTDRQTDEQTDKQTDSGK